MPPTPITTPLLTAECALRDACRALARASSDEAWRSAVADRDAALRHLMVTLSSVEPREMQAAALRVAAVLRAARRDSEQTPTSPISSPVSRDAVARHDASARGR